MTIPFVRLTHFTYARVVGLISAVLGLLVLAGWVSNFSWKISFLLAIMSAVGAGFALAFSVVRLDLKKRTKVEIALLEAEARYRQLFDSIDEGFCVIEMIYDDQQKPIDYR